MLWCVRVCVGNNFNGVELDDIVSLIHSRLGTKRVVILNDGYFYFLPRCLYALLIESHLAVICGVIVRLVADTYPRYKLITLVEHASCKKMVYPNLQNLYSKFTLEPLGTSFS